MSVRAKIVVWYWFTTVFFPCYNIVEGIATGETNKNTGVEYLKKYGYLTESGHGHAGAARDISHSLRAFQRFAGLHVTGTFDDETVKLMKAPRCGDEDPINYKRRRRYILEGSKWGKKDLTYRVENDPYSGPTSRSTMTPELISRTIKAALQRWSFAADISFKEIFEGEADIMIKFVRGYHGDDYEFDGRGNTLAHAFYPGHNTGIAGDVHYDLDEKFSLTEEGATNFLWVTMHEFGHSLGLRHSPDVGAVMYPWYSTGEMGDVQLSKDDKSGIRALYGSYKGRYNGKRLTLPVPPRKECKYSFNAMFHDKHNRRIFAFRGHEFYVLSKNEESKGPRRTIKRWKDLDNQVRAAYTRNDGYTIFFTRYRYYKYRGTRLVEGPTNIEQYGLPKEIRDMDAVFAYPGNGQTYFFKGDKYWQYNEETKTIAPGYPKLIRQYWRGLPDNIDAVLQTPDGDAYFFKGAYYYKFNHYMFSVYPGYPRPIGPDWLGCKKEESVIDVLSQDNSAGLRPSTYMAIIVTFIGLAFY